MLLITDEVSTQKKRSTGVLKVTPYNIFGLSVGGCHPTLQSQVQLFQAFPCPSGKINQSNLFAQRTCTVKQNNKEINSVSRTARLVTQALNYRRVLIFIATVKKMAQLLLSDF